jgi:arylsulfatase A-like enzyme
MEALAYSGVVDNTLVIFTSDNGGDFCPEEQQARERGFRNNGGLRGDKHTIWDGGFKVPFIARWPGKIRAGSLSGRLVNLVDLYATFQELVSGKVLDPKVATADSFSFYPTLVGEASEKAERPTMVVNDVAGVIALRMGEWKYIEGKILRPPAKNNPPILYNLEKDPADAHNVIEEFPAIAERLQQTLDRIRSSGSERLAV